MSNLKGVYFMKKVFSLLLAFIILIIPLYAEGTGVSEVNNTQCGRGTNEPRGPILTNEQLIAQALQDPALTVEQKQQIRQKAAVVENRLAARAATATSSTILYVTPIMQETNVWCAAATIQQTLGYMGVSYSSQNTIMQSTGSAPSLASVLSYLNSHQMNNVYIKSIVNNQSDLDSRLTYAYNQDSPVVFSMKAARSEVSSYWPYWTDGHFTNLSGKSYSGNEPYRVADPFYFPQYVSSGDDGVLYRTFAQLWKVNGNLFGSNNHTVGF